MVVLRGIIDTTTSDREQRRFEAGDITLALDTEGRGHLADAVGDEPLEVLFIPYVGRFPARLPLLVKHSATMA
ncbi:hypothetical protein ACIP5Y_27605 [Nocardia sp. NPDC088792]|uniref:hypothetical protein n=1 Tax=Nocardia sp. NPDC088792 TaxID=3364332 RepID=UPI003805D443